LGVKKICQLLLFCVLILKYFACTPVFAALYNSAGQKIPDALVNTSEVNWELLSYSNSQSLRGIQQLATDYALCTATLIDTGQADEDRAYILTAGHCSHIPEMGAQDVFMDLTVDLTFSANYYFDSADKVVHHKGKKLIYSTMWQYDLALYELNATIGELKKLGFPFYKISSRPPPEGTAILNVGLPINGMDLNNSFLHLSKCLTGKTVHLNEGPYIWPNSFRHNCSGVGGMSGSPLIDVKTNMIVGVFNTVTEDSAEGQPDCSMSRPCEQSPDSKTSHPQFNYAQKVDDLALCFEAKGKFNLYLSSCKLPKPSK
jgi:V8-like Glu-specific endopeptidase